MVQSIGFSRWYWHKPSPSTVVQGVQHTYTRSEVWVLHSVIFPLFFSLSHMWARWLKKPIFPKFRFSDVSEFFVKPKLKILCGSMWQQNKTIMQTSRFGAKSKDFGVLRVLAHGSYLFDSFRFIWGLGPYFSYLFSFGVLYNTPKSWINPWRIARGFFWSCRGRSSPGPDPPSSFSVPQL